jgi:hypothetical protein
VDIPGVNAEMKIGFYWGLGFAAALLVIAVIKFLIERRVGA